LSIVLLSHLSSSLAPPTLPSFPTRRSSDLSGSTFRHQLEADIEPFRGLLLGLFFLSVGMSLDLSVIAQGWRAIAVAVLGCMLLKDRKSTRLNSSHVKISYAVFCLKKKTNK